MKKMWPPQDQVYWYIKQEAVAPCRENITTDVAIVGGGMAGLAAAQAFNEKGKKVVLLEQYYCGSGATGKSSGFVTPNAELSLTDFSKRYSPDEAHHLWDFITTGVNDIRNNIQNHNFTCDYAPQNSLVVATSASGFKDLEREYDNLAKFGYKASLYTANSVQERIGSKSYFGGIEYEDTFGINGYAYCQELKKHLQSKGVLIFEETPVTAFDSHSLTTAHATITADYLVICGDRFLPDLGVFKKDIYHAQTFLMLSQQLTPEQVSALFPQDKLMVWDTDLIYNYFRINGDNRLMLGGGSLLTTYSSKADHEYEPIVAKLTQYMHKKFPGFDAQFEYFWPGLIGLSKDIVPMAGPDQHHKNVYYVAAAAGLPIAAALGRYSAEHLLDGKTDFDRYFSPYRAFPIGGVLQSLLGIKMSFALSNFLKTNIP